MNSKIVALYVRTAQKDRDAIKIQIKKLIKYCISNHYQIYGIYEDCGYSGLYFENRLKYNRMMFDLKKGKFKTILAVGPDRICRSIHGYCKFIEEIKKYDCEVDFVNKPVCDNTTSYQIEQLLNIFSEVTTNE